MFIVQNTLLHHVHSKDKMSYTATADRVESKGNLPGLGNPADRSLRQLWEQTVYELIYTYPLKHSCGNNVVCNYSGENSMF